MEANEFNNLIKSLGDKQSSLERLYCFYYPRIVRHITLKYGENLGSDVAQEFFINLVRVADKQKYIEFPTSWVYACAENIAKRKLYYENRYAPLPESEEFTDKQNDIDIKQTIQEALKSLDDVSRKIIELFYWDGYNQNEIASMLDLTPAAVRKRHSRAIKKLRKML